MRMKDQKYMTVGELAKKMGTTVRTLQFYDQRGLLHPSAESEEVVVSILIRI